MGSWCQEQRWPTNLAGDGKGRTANEKADGEGGRVVDSWRLADDDCG